MTILFSSNTAWSLYIFRADVIRALIQQGHRIVAAAPFDEHYTKQIEDAGCRFISVSINAKGINPFVDMGLCLQYRRLIKKEAVDFAFFYTIKPNIYGSIASRMCGIKHIAVTTGLGYTFINDNFVAKIARLLYKFSFKTPEEVWFLNKDDYDAFMQKNLAYPKRAKVIPGEGINLEYFAPIKGTASGNPFTFLLVARMLYDKGIREYVEAAKKIKKTFPYTRFLLLGQADVLNPSAIKAHTLKEWEASGSVEWLGSVLDVRPLLAQADCVVLPSYREGIPRTLMEAAAMEKPLIATDVPGCRDVVEDGVTGFLCKSKSSESLAKSMIYVLKLSNEDREKIGIAGREKMRRDFDVRKIIELYKQALDKDR